MTTPTNRPTVKAYNSGELRGFITTSSNKLTDLAITEHVTGDIVRVVMAIRVLGKVIHYERRHSDLGASEK